MHAPQKRKFLRRISFYRQERYNCKMIEILILTNGTQMFLLLYRDCAIFSFCGWGKRAEIEDKGAS